MKYFEYDAMIWRLGASYEKSAEECHCVWQGDAAAAEENPVLRSDADRSQVSGYQT